MAKKPTSALVPAAARSKAVAQASNRDPAGSSIETFVTAIGGRTRLIEMLAVGSSDPQVSEVLSLLTDPAAEGKSLAALCRQARLSVVDLFAAFSQASLLRGELRARVRVEAELDAVLKDLITQAQPHTDECLECQGTGFKPPKDPTPSNPNPGPTPCKTCYGRGTLKRPADLERQKLVLDLARLLPKTGGPTVNVNTQTNVVQPTAGLDRLSQLVHETLYTGAPVITDADLADPEPERG